MNNRATLIACLVAACSCKQPPALDSQQEPRPVSPDAATAPLVEQPPAPTGPLAQFHASMELESAGAYAQHLGLMNHTATRPAPPALRSLVIGLAPPVSSLDAAVEVRDGWVSYVWFMPGFTMRGEPAEALATIERILAAHGFTSDGEPHGGRGRAEHHFRKTSAGMSHHIMLEGPDPHTGGQETRCSTTISYEITSPREMEKPTVARILEVYPEILCTQVPDSLLDRVKPDEFTRLSCGGTWQDHYDFSVTLGPKTGSGMPALLALASELGFAPFQDGPVQKVLRSESSSGGFLYLSTDEADRLTLRIQPGQ